MSERRRRPPPEHPDLPDEGAGAGGRDSIIDALVADPGDELTDDERAAFELAATAVDAIVDALPEWMQLLLLVELVRRRMGESNDT